MCVCIVAYERGRGTRDERIEKIGKKGMNCLSLSTQEKESALFTADGDGTTKEKRIQPKGFFFFLFSRVEVKEREKYNCLSYWWYTKNL